MFAIGIPVGASEEPLQLSSLHADYPTLEEAERMAQGINSDGWVAVIYELRGAIWHEVSVLAPDIDFSSTYDTELVCPPDEIDYDF